MVTLIGLAFLLLWLLVQVFSMGLGQAILITSIIFIGIGLLIDSPWTRHL